MKRICYYLFISLTFFSCKKESNEPSTYESHITSINGKIDNWTLGSNYKIKICQYSSDNYIALDSSSIDNNGNFDIILSSIPTLGTVSFGDSIKISDNTSKISTGYLWLKVFSNSNQIIGSINYGKFTNINSGRYPGDLGIGYYYVDRNVQIINSKENLIINLSFGKGWNKCVQKYITSTKTELTVDFSETNLDGAHWFFH